MEEVGESHVKGDLLAEEEEGRPMEDSWDKEEKEDDEEGSKAAATTGHDGGGGNETAVNPDPDLIILVDELFHVVVDVDNMTPRDFYCLVAEHQMEKKVKRRAIKE